MSSSSLLAVEICSAAPHEGVESCKPSRPAQGRLLEEHACNVLQPDGALWGRRFESRLTDYDVCSNWGNWVHAAGLTGGRVNKFNISKQSRVRRVCKYLLRAGSSSCAEPEDAGHVTGSRQLQRGLHGTGQMGALLQHAGPVLAVCVPPLISCFCTPAPPTHEVGTMGSFRYGLRG